MNEYWIVTDNRIGKVIAHCGDINDAIMMVSFNPNHRSYSRHRFLMDYVIDVTSTTDKKLAGQIGLPASEIPALDKVKEKLPEGKGEAIII